MLNEALRTGHMLYTDIYYNEKRHRKTQEVLHPQENSERTKSANTEMQRVQLFNQLW